VQHLVHEVIAVDFRLKQLVMVELDRLSGNQKTGDADGQETRGELIALAETDEKGAKRNCPEGHPHWTISWMSHHDAQDQLDCFDGQPNRDGKGDQEEGGGKTATAFDGLSVK
jgi:hypothetical protein